jgi:hypothetical protein
MTLTFVAPANDYTNTSLRKDPVICVFVLWLASAVPRRLEINAAVAGQAFLRLV